MSAHPSRPSHVASGAALIGGAVIVALPHHVWTVVPVLLVSIAVAVAVHALAVHVPPAGWMSPFKWMSPFATRDWAGWSEAPRGDIDAIRSTLSGRRQRIPGGRALPPETLRLLKPCVVAALDADAEASGARWRGWRDRLSPTTLALVSAEPLRHPWWFHTLRPDPAQTAEVVHLVLDDLERVSSGAPAPHEAGGASPNLDPS